MRFGERFLILIALLGFSPSAWGSVNDGQIALDSAIDEPFVAAMSPREKIERAWFSGDTSEAQRIRQTRRFSLEAGQADLEGPARALLAIEDAERSRQHAEWAVVLAPDLPMAHAALAQALFSEGEYREAAFRMVESVSAIPRHLESRLWLGGILLLVAAGVFVVSPLAFILFSGLMGFSRAAHDLGDLFSKRTPGFARAALLLAVIGLPLAMGEGLVGLLLGGVGVGVLYGGPRDRFVLGLASILLVLGLFPILRLAGSTLEALDSSPVANAGLAVTRGIETAAQVDALREAEGRNDVLATKLLAFRALQKGHLEDARRRFQALLETDKGDPFVLTTLGNMAFRAGETREAVGFYGRARALEESPMILFDLAQAYARDFHMAEFERTLGRAQALDPHTVEELSEFGDADFVAQASFPLELLWQRMFERSRGEAFAQRLRSSIAPGWLGDSAAHCAGGFLLVLLICMLMVGRFQQAGRCSRCGVRICARCDNSMWSSHVCDGCHQLFSRPQGTDPSLRMRRLGRLRERERRVARMHALLRWGVPGAAGLLGQRPDWALVSIFLFWASAGLILFALGAVPDPLAMGPTGTLGLMMLALLTGAGYLLATWQGTSTRRSA